jgi:hypothetical protein
MELADAFARSTTTLERPLERLVTDGWYDPDSVAFVDPVEQANDAWSVRTGGVGRLEVYAALPDEA